MQLEATQTKAHKTISGIPVKNLWLLMLYASDLFRHQGTRNVALEDNPEDLPDLVAEILSYAVESRLHRNLTYGYRFQQKDLTRVRGRIDILGTERRQLLSKGRVSCKFEELSVDTARNRYVLCALEMISGLVNNASLAHRCRSLANSLKMYGVSGVCPTKSQISLERFGRNDSDDKLMVFAAMLAFELSLPTETDGSVTSLSPSREEAWVRKLFEKAIGGFYSVSLPAASWRVFTGKPLKWQIDAKTSGIDAILPSMRTDIVLENLSVGQRLVIDTKFNSIVTAGWYREETLRSGYLFQIYAYLMSQSKNDDLLSLTSAGLLLHPSVGSTVDETVTIQGHALRFATVDLTLSSDEIRSRLLELTNTVTEVNQLKTQ